MYRVFLSAVFCLNLAVTLASSAQEFDVVRTWTDSSGKHSVEASLNSVDGETAVLRRKNGQVVRLPRERLSSKDSQFLLAVECLRETGKQAALLEPHMAQLGSRTTATVQIINALRSEFPNAVGGNLLSGCLHALTGNSRADLIQAQRCLDDAIDKLEAVEAHFPGLHRNTLASAYSNRAVVAARQGSIVGAVNFLVKGSEAASGEIPFSLYHNASLLLNSNLDLGANAGKLAQVLARGKPEGTEQVGDHLMYTLDHDPFSIAKPTTEDKLRAAAQPPAQPPTAPPGNFLTGYGSGFLITSDLVLTNRHVAEGCDAFCVKNDSGLSIVAHLEKTSTSDAIDLAVLRLAAPVKSKPLAIREKIPRIGESFVVLGYPIPEVFEASLTASRGIVSKLVSEDLEILHDASTDPGNSGGPCIDTHGNVIGVHFGGSVVSKNNRNYAVSPLAINTFLRGIVNPVSTSAESLRQQPDFSQVIAACKDSVFMIECYSNEKPSGGSSPVIRVAENTMVKYGLIPDRTCFACSGDGTVDCGACSNGFVSQKKTVQVSVNAITGAPIYAPKAFKARCTRCSRGGIVRCPRCGGKGKLP